jgi:hypothetical protein
MVKRLEDTGYVCLDSPGPARIVRSVIDFLVAVRFLYQSARMWRHILPPRRQRHLVATYWRLMR